MSNQHYYTDERNAQIVIALLKAHGIRRVIANPGTTNIAIVGSVQNDPWFEVYSGVDERHSAYMAVGMAAATGEPVVLSCTGATASRNYLPALTEAYYRKLPVLALTSMQTEDKIGQLQPQTLDRSRLPKDAAVKSFHCRVVKDDEDAGICERQINEAILELKRHGGGPVHINLEMSYCRTFGCLKLPNVHKIERYEGTEVKAFPKIPDGTKIALFVGSGRVDDAWSEFAKSHDVAVFADEGSAYRGASRVHASLLCSQQGFGANPRYASLKPDLILLAGEVSGDYPVIEYLRWRAPVWRVSMDGEVRSVLGGPDAIFEMSARQFVDAYSKQSVTDSAAYCKAWMAADEKLRESIPELPFSNPWIAQTTAQKIPSDCFLHLGILNSLRSWNVFNAADSVRTFSNVGGFGIDGGISTLIGSALVHPGVLHFGIFGDLAFFYDLNSLGNRNIGKNLRLLIVNNGCGSEFNMYFHAGSQFGDQTNQYIAAGGHFGNKSKQLVRHFVEDLGFAYLSASGKDDYLKVLPEFLNKASDRSIVLECFTDYRDESDAQYLINHIDAYGSNALMAGVRNVVKSVLPVRIKNAAKELMK